MSASLKLALGHLELVPKRSNLGFSAKAETFCMIHCSLSNFKETLENNYRLDQVSILPEHPSQGLKQLKVEKRGCAWKYPFLNAGAEAAKP